MRFIFIFLKESASLFLLPFLAQTTRKGKQANTQESENKRKNTTEERKWKRARKGNKNSEADFFRNIKVKHHTHP
jgi:hypothetical protein